VHLDELRILLLSERETGRLVHIQRDLFVSAGKSLEELYTSLYAIADPFSEEARVLIERITAIKETLSDLYRIRAEKILSLARTQEEGSYIDREELKKLLPEEKDMFDQVVLSLEQARCRLVEGVLPRGSPHQGKERDGEPCATVVSQDLQDLPRFVVSRVLQDMDPFMGVDGRIYQLQREDLVTLPERNAEVLCERNIVLNINPGK
jgi:DNA replication factor GINS